MIYYRCNLDDYKGIEFPPNLTRIPVKGEFIECMPKYHGVLRNYSLPIKLEVCRVTHVWDGVEIELHLSYLDQEILLTTFGKWANIRN